MTAKINSIHYAARLWHALFSRCQDFKENFTFTPKYSGILILLNPEYLILLYEANTSDDQAQKNRTWSIWKKPTLRDTFFTGLLRLFLFKWKMQTVGERGLFSREKGAAILVRPVLKNSIPEPHLAPITTLFNLCWQLKFKGCFVSLVVDVSSTLDSKGGASVEINAQE